MPAPPSSSGTVTPISPSSAICATSSAGKRPLSSSSAAFGSTWSRAKARTVSCINRCSSVSSGDIGSGLVGVEAPASLLAEVTRFDVLAQQRAGTVLGIAEVLLEDAQDLEAGVEADQVREGQRAHRMLRAEGHDRVDVFGLRHTLHQRI